MVYGMCGMPLHPGPAMVYGMLGTRGMPLVKGQAMVYGMRGTLLRFRGLWFSGVDFGFGGLGFSAADFKIQKSKIIWFSDADFSSTVCAPKGGLSRIVLPARKRYSRENADTIFLILLMFMFPSEHPARSKI